MIRYHEHTITGSEVRCSGRDSISCTINDTRHEFTS